MNKGDEYLRWVDGSAEDGLYIGYCPDLFIGGCCHGDDPVKVYAKLCDLVSEEVESIERQGGLLPEVKTRPLAVSAR